MAGDGPILQKVGGEGQAWIELDGEVITYDLAPGETLRVHPGHVGMFEERESGTSNATQGAAAAGIAGAVLGNLLGGGRGDDN